MNKKLLISSIILLSSCAGSSANVDVIQCAPTSNSIVLNLTSIGLLNGEKGSFHAETFFENAVELTNLKVGDDLPMEVTSTSGAVFSSWCYYDGDGMLSYTNKVVKDVRIYQAFFEGEKQTFDPLDEYSYSNIYFYGANSSWTDVKMEYEGDGLFALRNYTISTVPSKFVIKDNNGNWFKDGQNDYVINAAGVYDITIQFSNGFSSHDVTTTLVEELEEQYPSEWYIRGTFNSWSATSDYLLTKVEGESYKYSINLDLAANDEFKIATSDWSLEFAYSHLTSYDNQAFGASGSNILTKIAGNYTFTIDAKDRTLVIE